MARPALEPGEDTIGINKPYEKNGRKYLNWSVRLYNGEVKDGTTSGKLPCTDISLRRRAEKKKDEWLLTAGKTTPIKPTSSMKKYLEDTVKPKIKASDEIRPRTKDTYERLINRYSEYIGDVTIADASYSDFVEDKLNEIASYHGTETAKQIRRFLGKWVYAPLKKHRVIKDNPMQDGIAINIKHTAKQMPDSGVAIDEDKYYKAVDYMLSLDPNDPDKTRPIRGMYTQEQCAAKRKCAIDICLIQATTGLRISEVLNALPEDFTFKKDEAFIYVRPEVSKTKKGRKAEILDSRVAKRIKERVKHTPKGQYVFASPVSGKYWDNSNCRKALKQIFAEVSAACDLPELNHSHIWRVTLSTIAAKHGVPAEIRAAAFGHGIEVNLQNYTDLVDISQFTKSMKDLGR